MYWKAVGRMEFVIFRSSGSHVFKHSKESYVHSVDIYMNKIVVIDYDCIDDIIIYY